MTPQMMTVAIISLSNIDVLDEQINEAVRQRRASPTNRPWAWNRARIRNCSMSSCAFGPARPKRRPSV